MTSQVPPNSPNSAANSSMSEANRGAILQRGGQEILLEKVADRFTVSPSSDTALTNLAQQTPTVQVSPTSPPQVAELVVDPGQKDQVMQQVRNAEGVNYASHVYQVKGNPASRVYLTDQVTVQFAPQVSLGTIAAIAQEQGLSQVKAVAGIPNTFVFQVTATARENPLKITNRLIQRPDVLRAEPNVITRTQAHYRPKDALYAKQWHLNHNGGNELAANSHIFVEKAWDITRGSRSVVVAIMDDGVDINHPDFQGVGKIVAPKDFQDGSISPLPKNPDDSHGTSCAGVAVAEENGIGVVGVAPGCALMPIRTTGYLDDDTIETLFEWAIANGASVISCSWGPAEVSYPLSLRMQAVLVRAATEGRKGKGCVIVFAAGNANRPVNGMVNENGWPNDALKGPTTWLSGFAVHPDVIAVAASTSMGKKAAYSNWGAEISVCAPSNNAPPGTGLPQVGFVQTPPQINTYLPGLGVFTTDRLGALGYDAGNFTDSFGGTSSACPTVAGVAALVLSANPDLTAQEVRQILQQTADKIIDADPDPQFGLRRGTYEAGGRSDWFGYGKVNAGRAVQAAVQRRQSFSAPSRTVQGQNATTMAIPDYNPQGVTSAIAIQESGTLRDMRVSVAIDHSFLGDVEVWLIAPKGERVLLQGRTLGRQTNLQANYTLQTTYGLRRFLNQPVQGQWRLQVIDRAQGDTGTLKGWQLALGI